MFILNARKGIFQSSNREVRGESEVGETSIFNSRIQLPFHFRVADIFIFSLHIKNKTVTMQPMGLKIRVLTMVSEESVR